MVFRKGGREQRLKWKDDVVAWTKHVAESATLNSSELVFVGYGVVAPEYTWDDYKGVDVKGKTLVMLINDPPSPGLFKDRAMTYYGRWTYKYEIAAAKGAAAALIIHETATAGYPFEVVSGSWGGENFTIQRPDNNANTVPVQSWITYAKADELCRMAGLNLATLKSQALKKDFRPVALPGTAATSRGWPASPPCRQ